MENIILTISYNFHLEFLNPVKAMGHAIIPLYVHELCMHCAIIRAFIVTINKKIPSTIKFFHSHFTLT